MYFLQPPLVQAAITSCLDCYRSSQVRSWHFTAQNPPMAPHYPWNKMQTPQYGLIMAVLIWPLPIPWIHLLHCPPYFLCSCHGCLFSVPWINWAAAHLQVCALVFPPHLLIACSFVLFGSELKCHFLQCLKFPSLCVYVPCLPKRMSAPWEWGVHSFTLSV